MPVLKPVATNPVWLFAAKGHIKLYVVPVPPRAAAVASPSLNPLQDILLNPAILALTADGSVTVADNSTTQLLPSVAVTV
jgi:hypothetical protein